MSRIRKLRRLALERLERRDLPAFVTPPAYPAGTHPTAMVTHDFNGDGLQDIAVTNQTTLGRVSVLLNTGGGVFGAPSIFPAGGAEPSSIAIGDINGDGRTDVVVTNSGSGTVAVMRGTGTGAFRRPINFSAGPLPWDVEVGDLNGDGASDVVVANRVAAGTVSVLLNNGLGTLGPATSYAAGNTPRDVVLTDFDGDGKLDVGVANSGDGTVGVLLGRGDGVLRPMISYGVGASPYGVAAADFNADGDQDVVAAHHTTPGVVSFALGNANGTFQAPADYMSVADFAFAVRVADVTGDGLLDLVTASEGWAAVSVVPGTGTAGFHLPQHLIIGEGAAGLAIADFDGDTKLDFAVTTVSGSGVAVMSAISGAYPATQVHSLGTSEIATGDVNGDGSLDIVSASATGIIRTILGNGLGGFSLPKEAAAPGFSAHNVALGEFTGDSNLDLVVTSQSESVDGVGVFEGNGDGTFDLLVTFGGGSAARGVQVADLNQDGDLDFVTCDYNLGRVTVFLGNGDGTFAPPNLYIAPNNPKALAIGDLNGDSHLDLAVDNNHHPEGRVSVLLGNGDGTFQPHQTYTAAPSPTSVAIADFDGDSFQDLALSSGTVNGGVVVLLGNGDGTFQAPLTFAAGAFTRDITVADFNADGNPDIAVGSDIEVNILLGNGDGTLQPPLAFPSAPNIRSVVAADFTGDGLADLAAGGYLAISNQSAGHVAVHINAADWAPLPIGNGSRPLSSAVSDAMETFLTPIAKPPEVSSGIRPADAMATVPPKYNARRIGRVAVVVNAEPTFEFTFDGVVLSALLPGSPAVDAGDNTDAPDFDQRGPGFPRIVNGTIDIGAFEVQSTGAPSVPRFLAFLITSNLDQDT